MEKQITYIYMYVGGKKSLYKVLKNFVMFLLGFFGVHVKATGIFGVYYVLQD